MDRCVYCSVDCVCTVVWTFVFTMVWTVVCAEVWTVVCIVV